MLDRDIAGPSVRYDPNHKAIPESIDLNPKVESKKPVDEDEDWEKVEGCFDKLGNEITNELASEVDPYDPKDLRLLGHGTKDERDERLMKLKDNVKTTTSHLGYGDYSWDPVILDQQDLAHKSHGGRWILTSSFFTTSLSEGNPDEAIGKTWPCVGPN